MAVGLAVTAGLAAGQSCPWDRPVAIGPVAVVPVAIGLVAVMPVAEPCSGRSVT